jgi:hypothetical protein
VGLSPDEITDFFQFANSFSHTMALGFLGSRVLPVHKADDLTTIFELIV